MIKRINRAIEKQSEFILERCLIDLFSQSKKIDELLYSTIEKIMFMKWYHQHEGIVNMIYLKNLKDNRFVIPIMEIAQNREIYRPFDDELESTLRKCVHALKMIDSNDSIQALEVLVKTGNENVRFALGNYQ